ncbi:MAG TPA: hypothetical protein VNA25_05985 [Phycisphaerae bacterium]|nr:hypothetical protein [Phycisphaerae bacterium]
MSAKHEGFTPGPWELSEPEFHAEYGITGYSLYAGDGLWLAHVLGQHVKVPFDQIGPNARLMADAPRLYAKLQKVEAALRGAIHEETRRREGLTSVDWREGATEALTGDTP